ncbi:ATP-dependent helicase C-terminal domain-containing protein, partial [Caulobacter sp. 17J65-9]|uniref:ATP-dependent helicase C-terminal domain-containing protein n=1 Tax=Caulobacter sp. 17J65-9 TaxID=2709382 RepID=UPI0013C73F4D
EHGRALADLPLPPRLAHMVVEGAAAGAAGQAGRVAALLTERGLGGNDTDLRTRLERLERDGSAKARDAKALAKRWADSAVRHAKTVRAHGADPGLLLAEAYPERIAKARGKPGEYLLASGRGVFLEPTDALAREPWLAVGELGGGESRDRVLLAAPLDEEALLDAFADRLEVEERIEPDPRGKIRARELRRLGRIVVDERLIDDPDPALIAAALMNEVERKGLSVLPWSERSGSLRERAAFLRGYDPAWPDLSDDALLERREDWLAPLLMGRTSLKQVDAGALSEALIGLIPWELQRRLDADAPERFEAPTGSRLKIDYGAEGGPRIEVRVQELFGLTVHPTLAGGRAPLTLALTSPAHRPVQVTKDLPGFWKGSWADVRSDMRGRYPKHPWPEDPTTAPPTTRAKPRGT